MRRSSIFAVIAALIVRFPGEMVVGRFQRGPLSQAAAAGVMAGMPLVAIGITTMQLGFGPLLECLAALITG